MAVLTFNITVATRGPADSDADPRARRCRPEVWALQFGSSCGEAGGGFSSIAPRSVFGAADCRAYVATLDGTAGASSLEFLLTAVAPGCSESVVVREQFAVADPSFRQFAHRLSVAGLPGGWRAGTYRMKFARRGVIVAEGTFSYRCARDPPTVRTGGVAAPPPRYRGN